MEIQAPSTPSPRPASGLNGALKDSEKKLAAPKIWQRLSGSAKSVVRHLDPKDFSSDTGLENLLRVLRESPLQKLPIPDSFSRLEKWSGLRRGPNETIPQLLVRQEEVRGTSTSSPTCKA